MNTFAGWCFCWYLTTTPRSLLFYNDATASAAFLGDLGGGGMMLVLGVVIFFGVKHISALAHGLGRGLREFIY
ncbi:twin-arginine translocase TatA/TatE family subunit [uncultured Hymenobacter sp.]|uniref:twin-arginine translocase TatA/TatE family subunit n=1 Tax=uncultured Hymenobacter sp. TaxID=170016 RepID=UPI0035CA46DE